MLPNVPIVTVRRVVLPSSQANYAQNKAKIRTIVNIDHHNKTAGPDS